VRYNDGGAWAHGLLQATLIWVLFHPVHLALLCDEEVIVVSTQRQERVQIDDLATDTQ
jgi:hypothetical protein